MIYAENILICISVPLLISLIFVRGNTGKFVASFIIGMAVCLISAYISGFIDLASHMGDEDTAIFISPIVEEIMKLLPLLLSGRKKGKRFYAIELQEESAELAVRNMALNGLDETVTVIRADAARASEYIGSCTADAVICNPPYSEPNAALASPFTEKAVARNQESDTLDRFLAGAFDVLKGKGRISIVYPAAQMLSVMNKLQRHHLEPKRFRLVYPRIDKSPNLVLIEALKDAKPTLHPLPPMVIYDEQGNLTNELKSVYHMT